MPEDSRPEWENVDSAPDEASSYLDTVTGLDAIQEIKHRSHRLLRPQDGDQILDVGCGVGDDVLALAGHVGPQGTVVGIDKSESLVQEARSRAGETATVRFQVGDATDLDIADDTYDACRADRVFQHLEDPREALNEMYRVTRPGGRITVTDPDWGTLVVDAAAVDPEQTSSVTDIRWANARQPTMGRRLYGLVRDANLDEVTIDPSTVVLTEFATANEVYYLEDRIEAMREAGAISADAADEWLAGVREAATDDRLFAAMSGATVAGTVPANETHS